jgi:RING-like zinc finger
LLALSERLGEVKPRGTAPEAIEKLAIFPYGNWTAKGNEREERCSICLEDYTPEHVLMEMKCGHALHRQCLKVCLSLIFIEVVHEVIDAYESDPDLATGPLELSTLSGEGGGLKRFRCASLFTFKF